MEPQPLYKLKGEFFKTLGHPARIRVLELLAERDRSVGELLPEIGIESSNLSQQLGVLRRAGVVTARKDGNTVELESELLKLNQNFLEHQLETQLVTGALLKMRLAITGRGS